MNNQFQDFSNRMIAKHKGFGQMFDSAPMIFPEMEPAGETGGTSIENHYIRNLYQIQNMTEENHLYRQNLQFVTNILEKKLEQRVVPSVEKLVEKTIQEELPGVEKQIVHEMTEQLHTLVKEGGINEITTLREQLQRETERQKELIRRETEVRTEKITGKAIREVKIAESERKLDREIRIAETKRESVQKIRSDRDLLKEVHEEKPKISFEQNKTTEITNEITNLTEQEILLRKIENIYYSSTQNHFYGNAGQAGEQTENSQRRTEVWAREPRTQALQTQTLQTQTLQTQVLQTQKVPQQVFDSLHLEYEAQDPVQEAANTLVPETSAALTEKPDVPEFLKTQERTLEQQRETIARQLKEITKLQMQDRQTVTQQQKEITKLQTQDRQTVTQLQNRMQQSERTEQIEQVETVRTRESENIAESQTQSKSVFRVEDLKRHRQPEEVFQEAELLYSFEQTFDEHWNEIRQEIVKELQNEKNRETTGKPSEEQNRLAEQIYRQAGELIRQKTGGNVTIHPAALEYLEQALDTEGGQQLENSTVLHTVERILDTYRVQREPVKAAARSVKPKTGIVQQILGESGNMRMQPQAVIQPGALKIQQVPGAAEAMMIQVPADVPSDQPWSRETAATVIQPWGHETAATVIQPWGRETAATVIQPGGHETAATVIQPGAVRPQVQMASQPGAMMLQQMSQTVSLIQVPEIVTRDAKTAITKAAMEQASMIYPEEVSPEEQAEQSRKIEKQIHEITQDIKEVKKTTVVHQEILTEQQKEVVREVIRQAPETVKEKDVSTLIRRQVQREVETQVDASLGQMTNRVYRRIEEKLRTERGRRGLL